MNDISKPTVRLMIFNKYGGKCAYCGIDLSKRFTIDHINPKFRGYSEDELKANNKERGKDIIENYNPCCFSCNSSKSTFTLEKWRNEIDKKYDRLMKYESSFNLLVRFSMIEQVSKCIFYFEKL